MKKDNEKTKIVSSLSEFVELIGNFNSDSFYFRGENKKYFSIVASTFRDLNFNCFNSKFYNHSRMLNDYYRKVANQLSDLERENFMPYAQHHGLPTPLIDISGNPLTALYFATENNNQTDEDGIVYLFSKKYTIDISSLMISNWNRDILNDFINQDKDVWNLFISEFCRMKVQDEKFFNSMFISLIYWCSSYAENWTSILDKESHILEENTVLWFKEKKLKILDNQLKHYKVDFKNKQFNTKAFKQKEHYLSSIYRNKDYKKFTEKFIQKNRNYETYIEQEYIKNLYVMPYLYLLRSYLYVLKYQTEACDVKHLPVLPNLVIFPTILFDRLLVQDGLFFYQLSMYKTEYTYNTQTYLTQNIAPDFEIEVKNKDEIHKQLNSIGISQEKLFPDPDNIANCMKKNSKYYL